MRYFKFTYDNGFSTDEENEYVEFDDDVTEEILNEYGVEVLCAYAESMNEDEREEYYETCDFSFKEITKEEYIENCEE